MKTLTNFINDNNVNENKFTNTLSNIGQLLSLMGGMAAASIDDFKVGITGQIVVIITLIWFMKSHGIKIFDDDTNESLNESIDIAKAIQTLLKKILSISSIKELIDKIKENQEYAKIEKAQDKKELEKLVNKVISDNKEIADTANKDLQKVEI